MVGIFLIIKGVYKILNYFATHGQYDFYNNDLLYGIVALVFGVIAVVLWEELGGVIGLVVGAWMIYGSLVRINTGNQDADGGDSGVVLCASVGAGGCWRWGFI